MLHPSSFARLHPSWVMVLEANMWMKLHQTKHTSPLGRPDFICFLTRLVIVQVAVCDLELVFYYGPASEYA